MIAVRWLLIFYLVGALMSSSLSSACEKAQTGGDKYLIVYSEENEAVAVLDLQRRMLFIDKLQVKDNNISYFMNNIYLYMDKEGKFSVYRK